MNYYCEMLDRTRKNKQMDIGILSFTSSKQLWQQFGKENIEKGNGDLLVFLQLGVKTKSQQIRYHSRILVL